LIEGAELRFGKGEEELKRQKRTTQEEDDDDGRRDRYGLDVCADVM
jgi:hypothetical protein